MSGDCQVTHLFKVFLVNFHGFVSLCQFDLLCVLPLPQHTHTHTETNNSCICLEQSCAIIQRTLYTGRRWRWCINRYHKKGEQVIPLIANELSETQHTQQTELHSLTPHPHSHTLTWYLMTLKCEERLEDGSSGWTVPRENPPL